MKKVLSFLLSMIMFISLFMVSFTVLAIENRESNDINSFINGITELSRKYDADKEFTVAENNEPMQIQAFSASNTIDKPDDNAEQEYTDIDFQTARLIVRASGKFDTFGAKEDVSGFEDFHILQYESPEAAMSAYNILLSEDNVVAVEPDSIVEIVSDAMTEPNERSKQSYSSGHLTPWSLQRTQADRLLDYLETADITMNKVTVAVIDSGIDYNHEFLKDRVDRTKFNSSPDGTPDDEMDVEISHGTMVSSVIVDNTPDNVRVKGYKALGNDNYGSTAGTAAAILKAVADDVDVINLSINFTTNTMLSIEALKTAFNADISVVCAVGNSGRLQTIFAPANISDCITVSATDIDNMVTDYSDRNWCVDVSAPGSDIMVAVVNNQYEIVSGTSFSSPCVASAAAIIRSVYPELTYKQIEKRIKNTAKSVNNIWGYPSHLNGTGMVQFCDLFEIPTVTGIETNLTEYKYDTPQMCVLSCKDDNAKILFTTDGTYPDVSSAEEYTEPIFIEKYAYIRAVAYYEDGEYYSDDIEFAVRVRTLGDEKDFQIDKGGMITKYNGDIGDLIIPEMINGIAVQGIAKGAFNEAKVYGITLPKTLTKLSKMAFYENKTLTYIEGENISLIEDHAFTGNEYLSEAEFPNVITIDKYAFENTYNLGSLRFDKLERIEDYAFDDSGIYEFYAPLVTVVNASAFNECDFLETLYLPNWQTIETASNGKYNSHLFRTLALDVADFPNLKQLRGGTFRESGVSRVYLPSVLSIKNSAFAKCYELEYVYMPSLTDIPSSAFAESGNNSFVGTTYIFDNVKTIGKDAFKSSFAIRMEVSQLETAKSLPQAKGCVISMSSTFKECTENTAGRNYKIYGTKGTYAEQWANENGHEFIEISQDTAVLTQLPMKYIDNDEILTADVIGFNRTYQWYANDKADNTTGTAIEGATDREFNPADYPAKYYYCVVTSTDVGYDPIEIRTGITENKTLKSADYSAYDAAVLKANALEREYYKDLTALDNTLAVDVSGLTDLEQSIVDAQTKAIDNALAALELKDADYSAYNAAVAKANALDKTLYADTEELDKLLAKDISGLTILNQDIVDNQTTAIENALKNLVFKPADYTEYNKAVEQANAIDRSLYQDLTALDEALAVDASGKNIMEQNIVDEQTQAILNAMNFLVLKSAEYSKVERAKSQIPEDLSVYTDESVSALREALNSVDYSLNITEQEIVDVYAQAITDAVNALELKPVEPPITEEPTEPSPTEPTIPDETTKPNAPEESTKPNNAEESTTSSDIQKVDIPKTGGITPISCTLSLLALLSVCIYITSRKEN